MARYAASTSVASDRSRAEIEATLRRYGANGFGYWSEDGPPARAIVQFLCAGWAVRFEVPMPDPAAPEFRRTPSRRQARSREAALAAWEQACRQRWRALALVVKAKLEAVESKIASFEEEFLAHLVLPNGQTVAAQALPQLRAARDGGMLPRNLLGLPAPVAAIEGEILEG